ncbi:MAG: hypothetical protein J6D29_06920 [Solobacterium sp.]|nr:hypothetical protein [Solobacterium sp.]
MKKLLVVISMMLLMGCANSTLLNRANDEKPPYISLSNDVFQTVVGKPINFSNITAYDDVDGLLAVMVSGYINYNEAGTYYPELKTADSSGNEVSVPITVIVRRSDYVVPPSGLYQYHEEEPCQVQGTKDPSLPCEAVLQEDIDSYLLLYPGESGKERCEAQRNEGYACEVIYSNDGLLWGYGLKEEVAQEEEKE